MSARRVLIAAMGLSVCLFATPAFSQNAGGSQASQPGVGGSTVPSGDQNGRSMTTDQFNKLQDYAEYSKRLTNEDKGKGKTLQDLLAEDKAAATAIAAAMPLSCQVEEAVLAAQGPVTVDNKTVQTNTYEVACANGMGYFLISQEPGMPYGITCFAADTTHAADIKARRTPGPICSLRGSSDIKALATGLMTKAGKACTVSDYRIRGQSTAAHIEFNEVKCSDNTGYMMKVAMPGSMAPVSVLNCHDSAMAGLPCQLSDNGGAVITLQTFKDALQQRGIACDAASDKDMHVIGQENVQKRYVVEFKCTQRPVGLVAYIPLAGAKAPFESLDCTQAVKRGVKCILSK
jgi:hypothetical protein